LKKFLIGLFQYVIWLQGYQKHKKPKVLKILAKVKVSNNAIKLIPTEIAPIENPNQDLINGLF